MFPDTGGYNEEHRHSGIGMMTPSDVHHGLAVAKRNKRADVLREAFLKHPLRFKGRIPKPQELPLEVWINKPQETLASDSKL